MGTRVTRLSLKCVWLLCASTLNGTEILNMAAHAVIRMYVPTPCVCDAYVYIHMVHRSLPQLFPSSHALIAAQITFNQVASARCVRVQIAFIVALQE